MRQHMIYFREANVPVKSDAYPQRAMNRVNGLESFKQANESVFSLGDNHCWVRKDKDVRAVENPLGIPRRNTIPPIWLSRDACLLELILGGRNYVEGKLPCVIADLIC